MLPYVCRLEDLGMSWMWGGNRASIASWLDRCKVRDNYGGIEYYLDRDYLELMRTSGRESRERVKELLEA
jgi:hypothetical protein